jgi:drug/metabolite transporter (DMT)-like permease
LAVAQTTALNASLYLAATPVFIAIASTCVWREKISPRNLTAIGIGVLGACILLFRGNLQMLMDFRIAVTDFWAVISAISWAAYCVSLPLKPKELSEPQFLATIVVMGCAILIVAGIFIGKDEIPFPHNQAVAMSLIYFAVFPSILAFISWNYATTNLGPTIVAPYNNLVPLLGGVFGVIFLGESIERYHLIGGASSSPASLPMERESSPLFGFKNIDVKPDDFGPSFYALNKVILSRPSTFLTDEN